MNFPEEDINNNYPVLNLGIYVNGSSPDKKRFLDNYQGKFATKVPEIILQHTYLSEKSSLFDSWLSSKKLHPFNRLGDWFNILSRKNSSIKDIKIIDCLPLEELLRYSRKQLIESITLNFEGIFPLLLLAISNNILSDINSYLEYRYNKYPHLFNPFNLFNINFTSENNKVIQASKQKQNQPEYTLTQCSQETNFPETKLTQWICTINRKKQAIFQGSPGTGKTFLAQKLAQHLITGGDGFWELIQFHPAYTYEDFIQGIRPQSEDGKLTYPVVPGRFLQFCQKAALCQDTCVLIIDEINRANLSQVFGELMYLLEYRDAKIPLAGSEELFSIPENVRIIGTMNTADRSIALVDHALRRRFAFIKLSPNYDILRQYHEEIEEYFPIEELIEILEEVNQEINDPNYQVGVSFFLLENIDEEIQDIWQMEIEPYLEEYFFAQPEKVDEFRWNKIKDFMS